MSMRKPCPGYTGRWDHKRFLAMLLTRGIDPDQRGAPVQLAAKITAARRAADRTSPAVDPRTARKWIAGERDPSKAQGGQDPYIWEICRVFAVDPGWLMTGEAEQ